MILLINIFFSFILHNIPNLHYNSYILKYNLHNNLRTYHIKENNINNTKIFTKEIIDNKKLYSNKIGLQNSRDFFKTKVYIHLEQLFYKTNIYHIGITFKRNFRSIRYDLRGYELTPIGFLTDENNVKKNYKTIFWGYCNKTLNQIIAYEKNININYVLGVNDCRHYVNNLTEWCMNNGTPIWGLYQYF